MASSLEDRAEQIIKRCQRQTTLATVESCTAGSLFVAVPVMAAMMWLAQSHRQMGRYRLSRSLQILGWSATGLMAVAALSMLIF